MQTFIFVTRPENNHERVEIRPRWWSCSKAAQSGDFALVYVTGIGIQYEWKLCSPAESDPDWKYKCDVEHWRTFDPPIAINEIKTAISPDEWEAPYQNFRGIRSRRIPPLIATRLRQLRPSTGRNKIAAESTPSPSELGKAPFTRSQYGRAFRLLGPRVSEAHRRMLLAHSRAKKRDLDVLELAKVAGQDTHNFTSAQYGRLAHNVASILGRNDNANIWTRVLAADYRDSESGLIRWVLFPEVAQAVRDVGWSHDVTSISNEIDSANDLNDVSPTSRRALVDARLGQGVFRDRLVQFWGGCALTGCRRLEALRASHIKPWCYSTNRQRLDPFNGLLLLGTLDALFDAGLITFDAQGKLVRSREISDKEIRQLGLVGVQKLRQFCPKHEAYLRYHRDKVFRG